jgi:hypothetical protein
MRSSGVFAGVLSRVPAASFAVFLAAVLYASHPLSSATAAVLKATTLACKTPADATKATTFLAKKDKAGLEAFSRTSIASGACTQLGRGVQVEIDEKQLPLSCVRLTGDLNCYWVADVLVDLHPGEKSAPQSVQRSGRNH